MNKRFQDCNFIIKLFRLRWYLLIPFKWLFFMYLKPFKVYSTDNENNSFNLKGMMLWKMLIGEAQSKMLWYYTSEEVFAKIDKIK